MKEEKTRALLDEIDAFLKTGEAGSPPKFPILGPEGLAKKWHDFVERGRCTLGRWREIDPSDKSKFFICGGMVVGAGGLVAVAALNNSPIAWGTLIGEIGLMVGGIYYGKKKLEQKRGNFCEEEDED